MEGFLTKKELEKLKFKSCGNNVFISKKCSIYGSEKISIGSNVRIDDFCLISAGTEISIGSYVHIASHSSLTGKGKIILCDFSNIATKCTLLSGCDDFSGEYLVNPTIPEEYLNVLVGTIILNKHSIVGANSIIMPNVTLGEGAIVGALSFIKKSINPFEIWAGNPIKFLKLRKQDLLMLEKQLNDK